MSRIEHRDSGLCIYPFGNAFDETGQPTFHGNGQPQPVFSVGRVLRLENRCLFVLGTSTPFEQLRTAVKARFEVVQDTGTLLAFRWRTATSPAGPTLYLGQCAVDELAHAVRAARILQDSVGCAVLSFDDRDAVLDEANTLIEAQRVIQTITQRPCFLMWNGARVDP